MVDEVTEVGDLIGVNEAASLFSVHPVTLRKWVRNEVVPYTRLPNGRVKLSRRWCEDNIATMAYQARFGGPSDLVEDER